MTPSYALSLWYLILRYYVCKPIHGTNRLRNQLNVRENGDVKGLSVLLNHITDSLVIFHLVFREGSLRHRGVIIIYLDLILAMNQAKLLCISVNDLSQR